MGWSLSLGSIAGTRIRVHITFLMFLVWIGAAAWQTGGEQAAIDGVLFIIAIFACVVAHEFGHILAARRYGAHTRDVILLPIGGVARMDQIPEKPGQELVVALAGPLVNVVIAGVIIAVLGPNAVFASLNDNGPNRLLPDLAAANLFLAMFNLLPAFPMDGGRALRALLALKMGRVRATDLATRIGHVLALGMGLWGLTQGRPILMLIAAFIWFGANAENRHTQLHAASVRACIADAMLTGLATLRLGALLSEAASLMVHTTQGDVPVLDEHGRPVGLLTRGALAHGLHDRGGDAPVAQVMLRDVPVLPAAEGLEAGLAALEHSGAPGVLATDAYGRFAGLLTLESLGRLLLFKRGGPMSL